MPAVLQLFSQADPLLRRWIPLSLGILFGLFLASLVALGNLAPDSPKHTSTGTLNLDPYGRVKGNRSLRVVCPTRENEHRSISA